MTDKTARVIAFERVVSGPETRGSDGSAMRETALAHEMVAGATRWRRWLDFIVDSYYTGDGQKLELRVRAILRLAFYDLLFLRTPDHAVVHEWVDIAKFYVRTGAGRLVNAMLRECIRSGDQLPRPSTGDPVADLGITYSHPDWMVAKWLERYGEVDCISLLNRNNRNPEYGLRVNRLRRDRSELESLLETLGVPFRTGRTPDFLVVSELGALLRSDAFLEGWFSVQDEAAGLVVTVMDPKPNDRVLDVCSAPGGKAMYAAEMMGNQGSVVATDRDAARLEKVKESSDRLGCTIVRVAVADATQTPVESDFDALLADVPCSGLGVLSKRADLRWRMSPRRLQQLIALQAQILRAAADAVRLGGTLIYSTCTIEPEENHEQVERFLSDDRRYELDSIADDGPIPVVNGMYLSLPHVDEMDGAFAARLRRVRA